MCFMLRVTCDASGVMLSTLGGFQERNQPVSQNVELFLYIGATGGLPRAQGR